MTKSQYQQLLDQRTDIQMQIEDLESELPALDEEIEQAVVEDD